MEAQPTSVLVVGGSLVGLSAAVFLAWRGVPTAPELAVVAAAGISENADYDNGTAV
jgi:glycine/D-amino acid oxidase-like deaminating enzyme